MKKTIMLITAILLIFSFSVCYAAEINFTDVKSDDWFYKNLQELTEKNIASGYHDNTFKPDNTLKFEEFIKMLVAATSEEPTGAIEGQEWYQPYIEAADEGKYITEQQKNLIGQNISRGTMAEILYNVLIEKEDIKAFTDAELQYLSDRLTDINKTDIKILTINGIGVISGYPDNTFKPDNTLTRAEAVAVISRVINPALRNPVSMPDTRTLDELPEVNLESLYDYPTLSGRTVDLENEGQWKFVDVKGVVSDAAKLMQLMHNRDYRNYSLKRNEFEKKSLPILNAYKEYKGVTYGGLRQNAVDFFKSKNDYEVVELLLSQTDWIENFYEAWFDDTLNYKVIVNSEFYTSEYLVIDADGVSAVRGILRLKYDSHDKPQNIKNELDLVGSEIQDKGKRILNLNNNAYQIYLDYKNIPEFKVGKWYEISMDVVMVNSARAKGLEDTFAYKYEYIYPIAVRELD